MDAPNTPGSTDPQHTSYYGHWQPAARPGPHASNVNSYSPSTTIGAGPSYVSPEVTEMNSPNTPGSTDPQRTSYYGQPAARPGPRASNMNSYSSSATIGPGPFDVSPEMKAPNTPGSTHPQRTSYYGQPAARPRPRVSNVNSYSSQTPSEYVAMLVAGEEIPVGRSPILIRVFILNLLLVDIAQHNCRILHMDPVGGLHAISWDLRELGG